MTSQHISESMIEQIHYFSREAINTELRKLRYSSADLGREWHWKELDRVFNAMEELVERLERICDSESANGCDERYDRMRNRLAKAMLLEFLR